MIEILSFSSSSFAAVIIGQPMLLLQLLLYVESWWFNHWSCLKQINYEPKFLPDAQSDSYLHNHFSYWNKWNRNLYTVYLHGSGIIGDNIDKYQKFHAYRELLKCFDKKLNTKRTWCVKWNRLEFFCECGKSRYNNDTLFIFTFVVIYQVLQYIIHACCC